MRNRGWLIRSAVGLCGLVMLFGMSGAFASSRGDQIPPETYIMGSGNKVYEPYFDDNFNGRFDPGEPFVDMNRNGLWDVNVFVEEGGVVTSKHAMFCYAAVDNSITDGLERDNNVGRMEFSYFNPFTGAWSSFTNQSSCVLEVPEEVLIQPVPNYALAYTFKVRAKDPSGNIDASPANREFYVGAGYLGTITSVGAETIVDKSAAWSDQALVGLYLNPNIEQTQTFLIVGNTLNVIYVEEGGQLHDIATAGDRFWVVYPMITPPRLSVTNIGTRDSISRIVVGTGNQVQLDWSEVAAGYEAQVSYDVYRDGVRIATDYASTTFTDPGNADPGTSAPLNGQTYTYQVEANVTTSIMTYKTARSNEVLAAPIDLTVTSSDMLQVSPGHVTMGRDTNEIVFTVENTTKTRPVKWSIYADVYYCQPGGTRVYGQYLWAGRFTDAKVIAEEGGFANAKAEVRLIDTTASWEPNDLVGRKITIAERFADVNANGVYEWNDTDEDGKWDYGEGEKDASSAGQYGRIEEDEFVITSNSRTSLTVDRDPTRIGRNEDGQVDDSSGAGSYYYIRDWFAMSALSFTRLTGEVLMEPQTFKMKLDRSRLPTGWFMIYLYVEQTGRDAVPGNSNPLDPIVCQITIRNGNPLSISRIIGVPLEAPGWGSNPSSSTDGIAEDTVTLAFNLTDDRTDFRIGAFPKHKSFSYWGAVGTQADQLGDMFIGCFLNPDVSDLAYWASSALTGNRPPQVYRIESYNVQGQIGSAGPASTLVQLEMPGSSSGHIGVDRRDYPPPQWMGLLGATAGLRSETGGYVVYRPWGDGSQLQPSSDAMGMNQCWTFQDYGVAEDWTRGQWTGDEEVMIRLDGTSVREGVFGIDPHVVATAKGDDNDVLDYWWRQLLIGETTDQIDGVGTSAPGSPNIRDYYIKPSGADVPWKGCKYVITTGSAEDEGAGGLRENCAVVYDSAFVGSAIALDPVGAMGSLTAGEHYFITQAYNPETFYSSAWVQSWKDFVAELTRVPPPPPAAPMMTGGATGCDCAPPGGQIDGGSPFKDANHNCTYDPYPTLTFLSTDITQGGAASFNNFVIYDSDGDDATTGKPRRWSITPSKHTILEARIQGDSTGRADCNDPDVWGGGMAVGSYPLLVNGDGEPFWDANGDGIYDAGDTLYRDPPYSNRDPASWRSNYIADDLESQDLYAVIEPGEVVTGYLILTNKSVRDALSVSALIAEYDPYVTLISNNLTMYDNVPSGRTMTAVPSGSGVSGQDTERYAFKFRVSEQLPCYTNGYDVTFYTKVFDSWGGDSYDDSFRVKLFRVDQPAVVPPIVDDDRYGYSGTSVYSNGDGLIQAGERIELLIRLCNESCLPIGNNSQTGQLIAQMAIDNAQVALQSPDASQLLSEDTRNYVYILPGDEGIPYDVNPEFEIEVAENYDGSPIPFELTLTGAVTYGTSPPPAAEYVSPCGYTWRTSFCENPRINWIKHYNKLSGTSTALLTSTLIDQDALFVPGSLSGLMLNPNTNQSKTFEIISNSVTSINVDGDLRTVAKIGDPYEVVRDAFNIVLSPGETIEVVMRAAPGQIASFNFEKVTRERVSGSVSAIAGSTITDLTADFDISALVGLKLVVNGTTTYNVVGNSSNTIVLDDATGINPGDTYETYGSAGMVRFFESNVRMYDDGMHKDGAAGDGVYVGTYTVREGDDILAEVVGYLEAVSNGNVGHVYASRPLMIDIEVPLVPQNVTAMIATALLQDAIRLEWDINEEYDFQYCRKAGYAIFRTEDPSQIPRTPLEVLTWATSVSTSLFFNVMAPEPFTDTNGNGIWDPNEDYKDWNGNDVYDAGPYWVDLSAVAGVTYYYFIKAFDAYGNSSDYSKVIGFTLFSQTDMGVDNMPDTWEVRHGLKEPMSLDTFNDDIDYDNDGLTNYEEFLLHTNPTDPDTDKDGECDGSEYNRTDDPVSAINPSDGALAFDIRPGGYAGISSYTQPESDDQFWFIDERAAWVIHQFEGAYLYAGNNTGFEVIDNTETALLVRSGPDVADMVLPDYYWIDGAKHVKPDTAITGKISSVYGIDPRTISMSIDGAEVSHSDLVTAPIYTKAFGDFSADELAECWVVDTYNNRVLELGGDTMNEIASIAGRGFYRPQGLAINPTTKTLWVADTGNDEVVKLKMLSSLSGTWTNVQVDPFAGTTLTDSAASWTPGALVGYSVNPNTAQADGQWYEITANTATSITIDESVLMAPGSSYAINYYEVEEQCRIIGFDNPTCLAVDWVSGNCWVADTGNDRVVRLASNIDNYGAVYDLDVSVGYHTAIGGTTGLDSPFSEPRFVAVNSYPFPLEARGACWVADAGHNDIVEISPGGTAILRRIHGFDHPSCIALDYYPGGIWVADSGADRVVKLLSDIPDGYDINASNYPEMDIKVDLELDSYPTGIAVNHITGGAWAALVGTGQVVRISADGILQTTVSGLVSPAKVSVASYRDLAGNVGQCWVADTAADVVYKVDPDIPDGYNLLTDTGYIQRTATGSVLMPSLVLVNSGGVQAGYSVEYQPAQRFGYGQVVDVEIEATDLFLARRNGLGNHGSTSFDFTTVERDTSAPFLANQSPPRNSHNASVYGPVEFDVLDTGTGVDGETVEFWVNGVHIFSGIAENIPGVYMVPTYNEEEMAPGYSVAYQPSPPFGYYERVTVEVLAADFAFPEPNRSRLEYSFYTEVDRDPPMVYAGSERPAPGQDDVDPNTDTVSVIIFDTKSGVDPATIEVTIDGKPVDWEHLTLEPWLHPDDYSGYRIIAPIGQILTYDQDLTVCVRAADTGGDDVTGANWMETYCWEFSTSPDASKPYFWNRTPDRGESGVRPNTDVSFEALDDEEGVDVRSISLRLKPLDEWQDIDQQMMTIVPIAQGFSVMYQPPVEFSDNTIVDVELGASDLADPSNSQTESYRFTLQDTLPPMYEPINFAPRHGAEEVAIDAIVSLFVKDEADPAAGIEFNSGIDDSSVRFSLNGELQNNVEVVWLGAPYRALIKCQASLNYCQDVTAKVECRDLEGNSMEPAVWSFKTDGCYSRLRVPETLEFNRTPKDGGLDVQTLSIQNVGYQVLTVSDIEITIGGAHYSLPGTLQLPLSIDGQDSYALDVSFSPRRFGDLNGRIKFTPAADNGETPPPVYTDLVGSAGYPPVVEIVTLEYSGITSARGGLFMALAEVGDPEGDADIERVEIRIQSDDMGQIDWGEMNDDGINGDMVPRDGVYSFQYMLTSYVPPDDYLVTVEVIDRMGYASTPWPYLRVDEHASFSGTPFEDNLRLNSTTSILARSGYAKALVDAPPARRKTKAPPSDVEKPWIRAAGFGSWEYTFMTTQGGKLMIQARVRNSATGLGSLGWGRVDTVELLLSGGVRIGDGWFLTDDEGTGVYGDVANDGTFVLKLEGLELDLESGNHILELVATDIYGNESLVWPYFHVE